jgi:hypothetical protein
MISISKETGIPVTVVSIIIDRFFLGLRKLMYKNADINIFGLFKIKMRKHYRKKLEKNPQENIRKRVYPDMRLRREKRRRRKK